MTFSPHSCIFRFSNMAENSTKAANMARILAIAHIIVGFLLFCFGIADLAVEYFWTGSGCYGIWIGVWVSCACVYFHDAYGIFNFIPKRVLMFKLTKRWIFNFTRVTTDS